MQIFFLIVQKVSCILPVFIKSIRFLGKKSHWKFGMSIAALCAMRLLCHLLCLGLNFAYGTCVAAAPAMPCSSKILVTPPVAAVQSCTACSIADASPALQKDCFARSSLAGKPAEIDYGLHMIRFVDRYWPAKAGFEPPRRLSTLCFCTPGLTNRMPPEERVVFISA